MQGECLNTVNRRSDWVLACPSPMAGELLKGFYNSGSGLADDIDAETNEYSRMQIVTGVDEADYTAYLEQMKAEGYLQIMATKVDTSSFAEFTKDGLVYHVAYMANDGEIRVSEDRAGVPLSAFAYDTVGEKQTQIYQYGLYYDPENRVTTTAVNCGMLYIVRLSDNSLVLVDSAHLYQGTNEMTDALVDFLHQLTDTQKGEKIKIAAWYMTHAHGDHVTVMAKLCNRYHDEIDLQRVMFNIPSYQVRSRGYDDNTTTVKAMMRKYYPDVKFLKIHTGQQFNLSDLFVEVLYTHEDAIGMTQFANANESGDTVRFDLRDYNCTSSVVRFTIDGKSVLLLGDISGEAEKVMAKNFSAEIWKSDVVQAAHHCFNYLNTLYPMIAAPIVFMPNSYYACHLPNNLPRLESMLQYVVDDQIYYESAATYGFVVEDGAFKLIYEAPVIGGEYDGSGI